MDRGKNSKHLLFFRPGEEARMLARCQFGVDSATGRCGAMFTYPIKGYPWRRNVTRNYLFDLSNETIGLLFAEVQRVLTEAPEECLTHDQVWSDHSEKANGILRDRDTGTLCYHIAIYFVLDDVGMEPIIQFNIRENSQVLLRSSFYKVITKLIEPYEKL